MAKKCMTVETGGVFPLPLNPLEVGIKFSEYVSRRARGLVAPQDYDATLARAIAEARLVVSASRYRRPQIQVDEYLDKAGEFITRACERVDREGVGGGECLSAQAWLLPFVEMMAGVGPLGEAYMEATEGLDKSRFRGEKMREMVIGFLPELARLEKEFVSMIKSESTWDGLTPEQTVNVALNIAVVLRAISAYKGDMVPNHSALDGVNSMELRAPGAGVAFFMVLIGGFLPEAECGVVNTLMLMDTRLAIQASRRQHKKPDLVTVETQRGGIQAKPHSWGEKVEKSICLGTGGPAFFVEDLDGFVREAKRRGEKNATGTSGETLANGISAEILHSIMFAASSCFGDGDPRAQALIAVELGRHLERMGGRGPDLLRSVFKERFLGGSRIITPGVFLVAMAVEDGLTHKEMVGRIIPLIQGDSRVLASYADAYLAVAPHLVPLQAGEMSEKYSLEYRERMLDLALECAGYDLAEAYQEVVATDMSPEQVLPNALRALFVLGNRHSRAAQLLDSMGQDLATYPGREALATKFFNNFMKELDHTLRKMLITKAPVFNGINPEALEALVGPQKHVVAPHVGVFLKNVDGDNIASAMALMESQIRPLRGRLAVLENEIEEVITGGLVAEYNAFGRLREVLDRAFLGTDMLGRKQDMATVRQIFSQSLTELAEILGLDRLVPQLLEGKFDSSSAKAVMGPLGSGSMVLETQAQTAELLSEAARLLEPLLTGVQEMVSAESGVARARVDAIKAYENVTARINQRMTQLHDSAIASTHRLINESTGGKTKAKAAAMEKMWSTLLKLEEMYHESLLNQARVVARIYEREFETRREVVNLAVVSTEAREEYVRYWTDVLRDVAHIPGLETAIGMRIARVFSLSTGSTGALPRKGVGSMQQVRSLANTMVSLVNPEDQGSVTERRKPASL